MPPTAYRLPDRLPVAGVAMTAALTPDQRIRLARLLAMLGSDYLGERDNAARAANRLVRGAGLSWGDVVPAHSPAAPRDDARHRPPPPDDWRAIASRCLRHPDRLSDWEAGFLRGLPRFPRLSPKQHGHLEAIAQRVLGGSR